MVRKILGGILIYSFIIYMIIEFGPNYDFFPLRISPENSLHSTPLFLLIGGIFWLVYDIIRRILKILTLPFNWLTFGALHMGINVGMLYLFAEVINNLDVGITLTMGSIVEVVIMAVILGLLGFLLKYI